MDMLNVKMKQTQTGLKIAQRWRLLKQKGYMIDGMSEKDLVG